MRIENFNMRPQKIPYYTIEILKYKPFYGCSLTQKESIKILMILQKYYNLKINKIDFRYKHKWYGGMCFHDKKILLFRKEDLNLGIVCHEFCHLAYPNHGLDFQSF